MASNPSQALATTENMIARSVVGMPHKFHSYTLHLISTSRQACKILDSHSSDYMKSAIFWDVLHYRQVEGY